MSAGKKALVLGGKTGLVGQALVTVLKASGWQVQATDRSDIDVVACDSGAQLEALIDRAEPDCVFNAVAYTGVDNAEEDPDGATLLNRTFPATLGRILKARPAKLVHFSTDFVFDGKKGSPYRPEDPTGPLNVYGRTKLAGEEALLAQDLPHCLIVRTAWLFGPGRRNFVNTILDACRDKRCISVVHDQIGSPTYTPDLAQYTLKLVEAGGTGIFHIVNTGTASWCELAGEAVSLSEVECTVHPIPSSGYPQKAARPAYSVLDCTDLARLTGITPRPWPQALREFIFKEFHAG